MITASKEFKEKLKNGANLVNYADITLSDGTVLNLTYKDFMIGGCQIEDKTTDGKFGVGFVIGKTLSIRLENKDERFSKYDFYQSIINLYVAMMLNDGSIEKIRKGVYYTIVPETPGDIIEISAVDGMYKLDKDYAASRTSYPATLQMIISDACLDCGIPIGFRQFDNMDFVVAEKPEKATYRQVVSWACQIAGYNARIDNDGYMQLIWYNSALLDQYSYVGGNFKTYPHDIVIGGGDFKDYSIGTILSGGTFTDTVPENISQIKSLTVGTDDVQITGIKVTGDDKAEGMFGEEGYLIEVSKNPFVNGKEQEVARYLGNRIVGMVFRPFSAQIIGNPLYEPFEVICFADWKGNVYYSMINSVSYKIGGYTQIACEAEAPVRNSSTYVSPAAQAVVEARRNTEKQLTTYDKAVQNMNQLAANAMGLYRESEKQPDGSYIYYQSNKPIVVDEDGKCHFIPGSVVYKSAAEGFFVSQDGGESFTAGFDAQGNAVVNVLSAIGIQFDWAQGGTLTLGGSDNKNGVIHIMDKDNVHVGTIDNNGIMFYSPTTNLQVVISPITGFFQRDAEGNEFWGLSYDTTISLPRFPGYKRIEYYTGKDTDIISYSSEARVPSLGNMDVRYTHFYKHLEAFWSKEVTYPVGSTLVTLQLPDKFKNKKWIVSLLPKGYNGKRKEQKNECMFTYGSLPKCYEDYSYTGDWHVSMIAGIAIPTTEYLVEGASKLNALDKSNAKTSPYLSYPEVTNGTYDITNDIKEEITEYELDFIANESLGTLTIMGKAMSNEYCVNELMNIRVLVTC